MLKKSKKGFTLAELLIVVAIIAVLTAIAVPLFVGAINNAEDSVKDANIRAVRGAAVIKILEDYDNYKITKPDTNKGWVVTAYVSNGGQTTITEVKAAASGTDSCVPTTAEDTGHTTDKYKVTVWVSVTDAPAKTAET